ncbi:MAG: hypothetical protein Q7T36_09375 [Fluviicoccus sp.]|uniref:hypothetical protein n=1 Tax=Fluviicoccus sp. TaxID=2003552 RepID=UPI002723736E|nr:hypothetical protein [Fluviicoccus sp.]MDO8330669.1 hypothetical protein [Fluviicoccus sp.]
MSDNWIELVPEHPRFIPDAANQRQARERLAEIAPTADEIEIKVSERVVFFNCGSNFGRICCPSCGADIPFEWWQDRMDEDYEDGFKVAAYTAPCCGKESTLNDLDYEWPQGFGRFAIDVMNPKISKLDEKFKRELELILGTKLRVICRHL